MPKATKTAAKKAPVKPAATKKVVNAKQAGKVAKPAKKPAAAAKKPAAAKKAAPKKEKVEEKKSDIILEPVDESISSDELDFIETSDLPEPMKDLIEEVASAYQDDQMLYEVALEAAQEAVSRLLEDAELLAEHGGRNEVQDEDIRAALSTSARRDVLAANEEKKPATKKAATKKTASPAKKAAAKPAAKKTAPKKK